MKPVTIKDVAERAGVGIGTVSRVLNSSGYVRDETRQRVLAAIETLGYTPNPAARQLSSGKTFTIGIITPHFTLPSFVERLAGIQHVLRQTDYDLVLYGVYSRSHSQAQIRRLLRQKRVDGLLILSLAPEADAAYTGSSTELPVVVVDNEGGAHYPCLIIDNVHGGELAARYLIEHGHRKIGFVGDMPDDEFGFTPSRLRFDGFQQVLRENDLRTDPRWYGFGPHGRDVARQHTLDILSQEDRPTAIFAASDVQAFGALAAARELDMRVPDDIAVIGFDDIEIAEYVHLTTVRQPLFESGRIGAQMIIDWLDRDARLPQKMRTVLPLEVVGRNTV